VTGSDTSGGLGSLDNREFRPRFDFLDGIRGLAASMVVIYHLPAFASVPDPVAAIGLGNPWVAIFITLSGFCLYLPAARLQVVTMPRSFASFMCRRALRIIPTWYASLLLCTSVGWLFASADYHQQFQFLPQYWLDVLSHLSLVHSMTRYSGSINGPGYTLGTEWQLYILMAPFLWIARRHGWLVLLGFVAFTALPFPGIPGQLVHKMLSPTFATPFVVGIIAARAACRSPGLVPAQTSSGEQCTSFLVAGLCLIAIVAFFVINPHNGDLGAWAASAATGLGCVFMTGHPTSAPARILSCRPVRRLGSFSYSLYLTHFPLLALLAFGAVIARIPGEQTWYLVLLPGLILVFGFAYLFHVLFERPFVSGGRVHSRLFGASVRRAGAGVVSAQPVIGY
jgi:peptidoglycan/LPS O-acetylase OafA/YrhL